MANFRYDKAATAFAKGEVDWLTDTIKVVLIKSSYTADKAAHEFLSDIPAGDRVASSPALANKTVVAGVMDADDVTLTAVATGNVVNAIAYYVDTGVPGTSRLLTYLDTGITGVPLTTNGGDVNVTFDSGPIKLLTI